MAGWRFRSSFRFDVDQHYPTCTPFNRHQFSTIHETDRMPSQNNDTWQRLAAVLLSVPLAIYLIWQFGSDARFGLLFTVIPIVLVVGFVVMLVVHLIKNRE